MFTIVVRIDLFQFHKKVTAVNKLISPVNLNHVRDGVRIIKYIKHEELSEDIQTSRSGLKNEAQPSLFSHFEMLGYLTKRTKFNTTKSIK